MTKPTNGRAMGRLTAVFAYPPTREYRTAGLLSFNTATFSLAFSNAFATLLDHLTLSALLAALLRLA
eukprot:CAMPEP_0174892886 /NCGR_PEP_ID=MMETSP0167-20121228/7780_1 /TAXON_ID=38298 /ORGANISM="Rhodella maculata, Strain CCMP736" /LENGTH=66 /DNA_ID=CAMNT_0016131509 /DNA_START=198 /DNA_END=395 /DNA_ORIENTATION=+